MNFDEMDIAMEAPFQHEIHEPVEADAGTAAGDAERDAFDDGDHCQGTGGFSSDGDEGGNNGN